MLIDDGLTGLANNIDDVPRGSVLWQICLYLLPLIAMLKYHQIGKHF